MSQALVLDTGPLSEIVRPPGQSPEVDDCKQWFRRMIVGGNPVYVPEITDYEVRRELVRSRKAASLLRLDALLATVEYLPITTDAMRLAADLWARARNGGWATADPKALDGDVILAAQSLSLRPARTDVIVVTQNVAHLSRYVAAQEWKTILP